MKKYVIIVVTFILIIIIDSCSEKSVLVQSHPRVPNEDRVSMMTLLTDDSPIISKFNQTKSGIIPLEILNRIKKDQLPQYLEFTDSEVKAIMFSLESNMVYESLVIYTYNDEYIPCIAKSEAKGDNYYIGVYDLNGSPYFDFNVNDEHLMSSFKVHKDMPIFKSPKPGSTKDEDPTCMELYPDDYEECMLCAIRECTDDLLCFLACTYFLPSCLIGFSIGCILG